MDWFFWVIIAIVGLAILIGGLVVALDRRRQLEHREKPELAEPERRPDVEVPPEAEPEPETAPEPEPAPAPVEPVVTEPEIPVVVEPPAPTIDHPEAPASRWARLRRRLSSSNNALARALADLLSVDRIDADTWDDFETTLITSDLGVGPATELTEALRRRLAVDGAPQPSSSPPGGHAWAWTRSVATKGRTRPLSPSTPSRPARRRVSTS